MENDLTSIAPGGLITFFKAVLIVLFFNGGILSAPALAQNSTPQSLLNEARACKQKDRQAEAIAYCDRAIKMVPKSEEAYFFKGLCLMDLGKYPQGIETFNKVIALSAKRAEAFTHRGQCYGALKDYTHASADFSQALKIDPVSREALHGRATAYEDAGMLEKAEQDLDALCRIKTKSGSSHMIGPLFLNGTGNGQKRWPI